MDKILLDHGSGGRASHELIRDLLYPHFENSILAQMDDSGVIEVGKQRVAFSTDSYTVDPIFFPGGDIGELAINGTVNDLSMCGATPLYLSVGLILEEGLPMADLKKILESMQRAAEAAHVRVVTGDTKVVHRNAVDKIFINTSGIGVIPDGVDISGKNARAGDKVLLSGTIADHGMTILTQREGLTFDAPLESDTAPLNHMVAKMMSAGRGIHAMRDPTRGGLATTLNEIALQSGVGIRLNESAIPVRDATRGACALLGLDPLYIANEGKLIACIAAEDAARVLAAVRDDPYGKNAAVIGEVVSDNAGKVFMETGIGGMRIIDMLTGEPLPRIC
jgi:hydrogenase expression/formation protein HypE